MLSFDDFKKLAKNTELKTCEKVGFDKIYREKTEDNIFEDIANKLNLGGGSRILDIGCGCSKPVFDMIDFAEKSGNKLFLIDSREMLDNVPNKNFITKIACEFPNCKKLNDIGPLDYIIMYSVLHHVVYHANYIKFLDKALSLLKSGGKMLIGDIPNITKKKRFLSSEQGIEFHKKWSNEDEAPEVKWNFLEENQIEDSIVFAILQRYRAMGFETYLLPQKDGLPMNKTREDILIVRN